MAVSIKGNTYYRTKEACQRCGISRSTLHRWIKEGIIENPLTKDRNGWRLFTDNDVKNITAESARIEY